MSTPDQPSTTIVKRSGRGAAPGERRGGRSKGTPNKSTAEIKALAQVYGAKAIEATARLAGLIPGPDGNPEGAAISEQARITALNTLLDRGYGKSAQAVTGEEGEGPIKHMMEIVWSQGKAN